MTEFSFLDYTYDIIDLRFLGTILEQTTVRPENNTETFFF